MPDNDQIVKLRDLAIMSGYSIPLIETFRKDMQDDAKLERLRQSLLKKNVNFGDFATFKQVIWGTAAPVTAPVVSEKPLIPPSKDIPEFNFEDYRNVEWVNRAITNPIRTKDNESVRTMTFEADGKHYVAPTIRLENGKLITYTPEDAFKIAVEKKDAISFNTAQEAEAFSHGFSDYLGRNVVGTDTPTIYKYWMGGRVEPPPVYTPVGEMTEKLKLSEDKLSEIEGKMKDSEAGMGEDVDMQRYVDIKNGYDLKESDYEALKEEVVKLEDAVNKAKESEDEYAYNYAYNIYEQKFNEAKIKYDELIGAETELNTEIDNINAQSESGKQKLKEYNELVNEYNSVAAKYKRDYEIYKEVIENPEESPFNKPDIILDQFAGVTTEELAKAGEEFVAPQYRSKMNEYLEDAKWWAERRGTSVNEEFALVLNKINRDGDTERDILIEYIKKAPPTGKLTFMDKSRELGDDITTIVPFLSGATEAAEMYSLLSAANRIEDNIATDGDILLLKQFIDKASRDTEFWYDVLNTVSMMPSFMGELLTTGGIYKAVTKGTVKGATNILKRWLTKGGQELLEKKVAQIMLRVGGGIVGATAQTIPAGFTRITAASIKNMLPKDITVNEKTLVASIMEGDEVLPAIVKGVGTEWIETVSEASGRLFNLLGKGGKEILIRHTLLKTFLKTNPTAKANDFMKIVDRMGYHGIVSEMLEERAGEVGRAIMGLGEWELPSWKQLGVELVSFTIPGAMVSTANFALNKKPKESIKKEPIGIKEEEHIEKQTKESPKTRQVFNLAGGVEKINRQEFEEQNPGIGEDIAIHEAAIKYNNALLKEYETIGEKGEVAEGDRAKLRTLRGHTAKALKEFNRLKGEGKYKDNINPDSVISYGIKEPEEIKEKELLHPTEGNKFDVNDKSYSYSAGGWGFNVGGDRHIISPDKQKEITDIWNESLTEDEKIRRREEKTVPKEKPKEEPKKAPKEKLKKGEKESPKELPKEGDSFKSGSKTYIYKNGTWGFKNKKGGRVVIKTKQEEINNIWEESQKVVLPEQGELAESEASQGELAGFKALLDKVKKGIERAEGVGGDISSPHYVKLKEIEKEAREQISEIEKQKKSTAEKVLPQEPTKKIVKAKGATIKESKRSEISLKKTKRKNRRCYNRSKRSIKSQS